jgi:FAD/FMN-containing dehydrogenase
MAKLLDGRLRSFQRDFTGKVIAPDDPEYDTARSVWNGAINRRPALIARCSTPAEVVEAIRFARDQKLEISVRGGGHNFAGSAVCDDGLMIDLSAMRQVSVDSSARRGVAGGGATWGDLDAASQLHGLAVTGGFVSHTGVGGLTLGGGIGWMTSRAGLSSDNLLSAEVVTADGRLLTASAREHPDLFWAIRGGGGNFGVVTSFEFQLHPTGPLVNLGLFFWEIDKGEVALRFARDYVKTLPEDAAGFIAGLNAPPAPFVPSEYHFRPGFALVVVGFGSAEEHGRLVQPVRDAGGQLFELVTPIPYAQLQKLLDEGNPWGTLAYEKALYLDELSDDAIRVMVDYVPRKASPQSFVPIFVLGGAYRRFPDDATAFGGSRSARFAFNIAAICPTADLLEADRAWVRSFWQALRPYASGAGSYVNFMTEYEQDRVRASYGPTKYERLALIKAEYDPDNVFHLNANIRPALQPAGKIKQAQS